MFIRCAFFKGKVRDGYQEKFDAYISEVLTDTWRAFPGAQEVRVMREVESDNPDMPMELVIAIKFDSREAIDAALNSPERFDSREKSKALIDMFDGEVFHTVFRAEHFPLM
ncbi:antibiotic biosynthesis monooxygenase [Pararhizobium sp. IMCC21322]|uniref:antibiotic biosynthesis monooxygenase n=1 Tax=Pararhizobium sp. IMCC21322 TaxID=3067903 RepID=UPI002741E308|nr:antibiotic biosynthesis monooxygenase [Pararhizobium sp. IMCC21322]